MVGREFGLDPEIRYLEPPRIEAFEHYYNPDHQQLLDLGYEPTRDMDEILREMFADLLVYEERIREHAEVLIPHIFWSGEEHKAQWLK